MSIWNSIDEPVRALNADYDAANYRAEGERSIGVGVAITTYHDHIRLAVWDDADDTHIDAILSPEAARKLRDMLDAVLPRRQGAGSGGIMTTPAASSPQWRCYCPISLCRALDPCGFRHALAYIRRTYGCRGGSGG